MNKKYNLWLFCSRRKKKSRLGKKSHNLIACTPTLEEKSNGIKKSIKTKNCKYCSFLLDHLQNVSKIWVYFQVLLGREVYL